MNSRLPGSKFKDDYIVSSSARAPYKSPKAKKPGVVKFVREDRNKNRKNKQPKLNNIKQTYVSSPSHARVNLCSPNSSRSKNLQEICENKSEDLDEENFSQPRLTKAFHSIKNPFQKYYFVLNLDSIIYPERDQATRLIQNKAIAKFFKKGKQFITQRNEESMKVKQEPKKKQKHVLIDLADFSSQKPTTDNLDKTRFVEN